MSHGGMGKHQSAAMLSDTWLTPPEILRVLGPFDLDPCAAPEPRPWPTAATHYTRSDDGLLKPWRGRIWLNPPYGTPTVIGPWLGRMADHDDGIALIFARTETSLFHETIWQRATAILFLRGRLFFHRPDGSRAASNAGAPSCLVAYGAPNATALATCGLAGHLVQLRSDQASEPEPAA